MCDSSSDYQDDSDIEESKPNVNPRLRRNAAARHTLSYRDNSDEEYPTARARQKRKPSKIDTKRAKSKKISYKEESSEDELEEQCENTPVKTASNFSDLMEKMKTNRKAVFTSASRESSENDFENERSQGEEPNYSSKDTSEKEENEVIVSDSEEESIASNQKHSSTLIQGGKTGKNSQEDDCRNKSGEMVSNEEDEHSSEFDSEDYEKEIEEKPRKRVKKAESDSDFEPDAEELQRVNKRVRKQVTYNTSDLFDSEADSEDDEEWQFWRNSRKRKGPPRERRNKGPVYSSDSDDLTAADIHSDEVISQRDLAPDQQIQLEAWAEFVNFSQHVVAPIGTGGGKKKKKSTLWEIEFTDAWNPYTAGHKQVCMFLTLHRDQLKIKNKDLDIRINAVDKYLPHLNIKETQIKCPNNQKFPYPLVVLMDKSDLKYQDEWNHFIKFCAHTAQVDPFLAKPQHVQHFILGLFLNQKLSNAVLKPFPHFYQENISHLLKALGFYLESAYDCNALRSSSFIRDLYSLASCLDERLEAPPGAPSLSPLQVEPDLVGGSTQMSSLLSRVSPSLWYWRYHCRDHSKEFWQHGTVRRILTDVHNKILTENDAAWELGVTADMVACALQRAKPENDQELVLTLKQYLQLEFGDEASFWKEDSTQRLMEEVRNRIITVDNASFQLGVTYNKVCQNAGQIKSEEQVEVEKAALKEKQQKAKQTANKQKLSPLELQIKMAEGKNEDEMSPYEKMRLNNMRQKLEMFRMMGLEEERQSYKDSEPTTKRVFKNTYIAPREKSSRLKKIADQKEIERETGALHDESKVVRQSPSWVGRTTPMVVNSDFNQKSKHLQNLSEEEMRTLLHVPKLTLGTNQLIANNLDYHKGDRFMQRLCAEVHDLGEEAKLEENGRWEGMRSIGGGKVSNQELVSLDMRGDIVACGDCMGGVGFWLGEKSLLYRPHNALVCRTLFVGSGQGSQLVSASHDGTIRVLDFSKQEFTLMYSWHKHFAVKQGVVWIEPLEASTTWLINTEGGQVLQMDTRENKVNTIIELKEAERGCGGGRGGGRGKPRNVVTPALTGSNISVHPLNKSLISICDKETVDIYDIRNIKACVTSIHHPNPPPQRGNAQFDSMNYHAGSGWSKSGAHFLTCPRLRGVQGSINTQSSYELDTGIVTEWPREKHQAVTAVNMLMCEGAMWCPWEENIFFASVNKKPGAKSVIGSNWGLVGVDVDSGETVMDLDLSRAANLVGLHHSRPQLVVGNSSAPGVLEIFSSEEN